MRDSTPASGQHSERLSLAVIAASLIVIGVIVGLSLYQERGVRDDQLRTQGVALARLLATVPIGDLRDSAASNGPLDFARELVGDNFAFAIIVDPTGRVLSEVSAPGVIPPPAEIPGAPSGWLGERLLTIGGGAETLHEVHAPLLENGELAGFLRVASFASSHVLTAQQLSFMATLALPIFLLVPLFHILLRREIRPLRAASLGIGELIEEGRFRRVEVHASGELAEFVERFNSFVDIAQKRMESLESDQVRLETSAKLIQYKKTRVEQMLDALPEAVLMLDDSGAVCYANSKITSLLGLEPGAVVGTDLGVWCEQPELASVLQRCAGKAGASPVSEGAEFALPGAASQTLGVSTYPLFSQADREAGVGTLVVIRDISPEVMARQSRGEFVGHLAHELKTPLNVLSMYSESLLGEAGQEPGFRNEALNVIHDETARLAALIDNLLNLTRIESGSLEIERQRVKTEDLLRDALDTVARSDGNDKLEFVLDVPRDLSALHADKDLLRVALNNLLTNAVKYNRPGGSVTLAAEETDELLRISVRDTGIGIAAQDRSRIFDRFFRSEDDVARERSGHGLGLALARDIVELHSGSLSVDSTPGEGTEFVIELWKEAGLLRQAV